MGYTSELQKNLEEQLTAWNLPVDLASELGARSASIKFEKGATIFARGATADVLFWVQKGFVKLNIPHRNGNSTLVAVARPGELLGLATTRESDGGHRQTFEAQALTRCWLNVISREHLNALLRKLDHETLLSLLDSVNVTWSSWFERRAGLVGLPSRERLEAILTDLGARFGIPERRGTMIILELTQNDLAEMVGSSRPMVAKLLMDFATEGLLVRGERGRLILRNRAD